MSSTSTGVLSRQTDRSGTSITTRCDRHGVSYEARRAARRYGKAMEPTHCSLSSSGPTIKGFDMIGDPVRPTAARHAR